MSTITQFPSGNTQYRIEFDYLARTFVVVTLVNSSNPTLNRVLEVGRDYRFLNPTMIEVLVDQSGFDIVRIHRQTGTDLVVDFRNGSVLTASDLTNAELQAIHIAEEGRDQTVDLAKEYADAAGSSAGNAKDSEDEARRLAESIKAAGLFGYITRRSFEKGFNVQTWNEVLLWEEDGEYYRWHGALPKVVPPGSTPISTGGIGVGAWLSVGDATLRGQLYSSSLPGTSLIKHSDGKTVQQELNSILSVHSRVFSVDDPQFAGGAKGDSNGTVGNGTDDTAAIYACFQAAIAAGGGKIVFTPGKTYRTTYTVIYGSNMVIDMQGASIFFDVKPNDGSVFMPDSFQSYTKFTTDVIFMNGQINGRTGAGNGIGANRARRLTLFNIGSKYLHWHLFDGAGAQQVKIINCWCEGTNSTPFQIDNATYNKASWGIDASGNVLPISFDATGVGGWSNGRDVLIMGCTVRNALYSCVHIHNTNNQNIQVINCHFEDSKAGVFADANATFITTNTLIQGCTFIRCTNPIIWGGGFRVLRILNNNLYGENTTAWYYGVRIILPAAGILETLSIKDNTFTGLYRPIIVNGVSGFGVDDNIFQKCGGTTPPSSGDVVTAENPLSIVRLSGCKGGTAANNVFQDCNDPVCISVARDEVDSSYSSSVEVNNNMSRGSGCLLTFNYADRCTARDNKYVGLTTDFYGIYVGETSLACVIDGFYCTQGSGQAVKVNGGPRHVVRDVVAYSDTSTQPAIVFHNTNTARSMDNVVMGGYSSSGHILLSGTTVNYVGDEPNMTIAKQDTATGVKVVYTKAAVQN